MTETERERERQRDRETEREIVSESDSVVEMLEFPGQEFETTLINMLRAEMGKVDNMREQRGNVSRERKCLRKNQEEMFEIGKHWQKQRMP